mgnify:CR=1 FL=1
MNNRVTGLSLIAVSVAYIAYQAYKNHREAVENERQARIANDRAEQLAAVLKCILSDAPSPFNDALVAIREKHNGDSVKSTDSQLI